MEANYDLAIKEFLRTGAPLTQLSKQFQCKSYRLSRLLKEEHGIEDIKQYSREKLNDIYALYLQEWEQTNEPWSAFCETRHIGKASFHRYLCDQQDVKITEDMNMSVFTVIDSSEKAYWLGFVYADGCNCGNCLSFALQYSDLNHLKKLRKFLGLEHRPIRFEMRDRTARFEIPSTALCSDLNRSGKYKGRKYCQAYPGCNFLPRIYTRDFIRGFMDGDGSIGRVRLFDIKQRDSYSRKIIKVAFRIQSERFMKTFIDEIKRSAHVEFTAIPCKKKDNESELFEVYLEGEVKIRIFLDFLYQDATVYLDRKYARYLRYILPSDLEIDQIISAKLSENILPDLSPSEDTISQIIRTEGDLDLDFSNVIDNRKIGQGQRIEDDPDDSEYNSSTRSHCTCI